MVLFLYTNKVCEFQAIACIKSMERNMPKDMKIVYFTIGFISSFEAKNLIKVPITERDYPTFHYYKAELSLEVMDMFPEEKDFFFTDTDILFSRKMDFTKLTHTHSYPLATFGPHEQPYIWERVNDELKIFDEKLLMQYLNVPERTLNYQWSCFYAFNSSCYPFFEEYTSLCKNQFLVKRRKWFFPFHDETSFNVCLWKNNARESLGYVFVNTHNINTVKRVEENNMKQQRLGENLDEMGSDWEYIHDSNSVLFYHGFKEEVNMNKTLNYLLDL